jgi:hypothetical protein
VIGGFAGRLTDRGVGRGSSMRQDKTGTDRYDRRLFTNPHDHAAGGASRVTFMVTIGVVRRHVVVIPE